MSAKSFTAAFDIGSQCDKGRRPNNEDKVLLVEKRPQVSQALRRSLGRLYIVADGVGGNDYGEVASERVVNGLMYHYYEGEHPEAISPPERLQRAIQATTREIFDESLQNNNNMRSTLAAALILDPEGARAQRRVVVANIGDSPVILFRKGQPPRKLTQDHVRRDHSLAQAMGDAMVNVSMFNDQLQPDDVLVICSDGLSDGVKGPVPPSSMQRVVRSLPAQAASNELVRMAKRVGSQDNISAIVIRNGARPLPTRMILPILGVLVLLALMAGGAFVLIPWGDVHMTLPNGTPLNFTGSQDQGGPQLAATSEILPTFTPTPTATPSPTPRPKPTAVPQPTVATQPEGVTAGAEGADAGQSPTTTPEPPTTTPEPPTTTPEPPTTTPEPPTTTPEPPTATRKPHSSGGDGGGGSGGSPNAPPGKDR